MSRNVYCRQSVEQTKDKDPSLFPTPLIWTPNTDSEEWVGEVSRLLERVDATKAWLRGELPVGDYLDLLDSHSIDVFSLPEYWGIPEC